ncbi:transposase [Pseudarthrobacter sp. SSS035]|uniref:IS110 family transposase n=1 Tax=Pseudarthrobacter sp. SSS035 TaxID=2931399 RepID=UPI00200D1F98|nr:transposase [Pseudarthrobacter sp. SSS035]
MFYVLEAHGLEPWLVNARDVRHLPGRPKTDVLDSIWLCKVAERQMLRPSFVPPAPIRRLRDLTRYRIDLVGTRTAEKNRVEKLLEDACIKLSVVASDIFGVSGREMMAALIDGERNPKVHPASFAVFDLLAMAGHGIRRVPLSDRRALLEELSAAWTVPLNLSPATTDREVAPAASGDTFCALPPRHASRKSACGRLRWTPKRSGRD